jgi:hypothetical protein
MAENNFSLDKLAVGGGSGTLVSGYRSSRVHQSRPDFFDVTVLLIQFMVTEALIGQLQPLRISYFDLHSTVFLPQLYAVEPVILVILCLCLLRDWSIRSHSQCSGLYKQ